MINRISDLCVIDPTSYSPSSVNTSTDTITLNGHGLKDGCKLRYDDTNWTLGGLTDQSDYFVISATTNTFQLSEELGGSAVDITSQSGSGIAFYVSPIYLKNIVDGVDGASVFGFDSSALSVQIEDGQTHYYGVEDAFDIRTLKDNEYASNLEQIAENSRGVYISGLTPSGFVVIGDKETSKTVKLAYNEQFTNPFAFSLLITKTGSPMWDKSNSLFEGGMWSGENGLGIHLWADNDSDGVADGWSSTFDTDSFSSGAQSLTTDTDTATFSKDMFLPFTEQFTFSVDVDSRTGTYATEEIEITALDIAGNAISSLDTNVSATGRASVSGTLPANTVSISVFYGASASSGTVTTQISDPALRRGTTSTYTKF